MEWITIVKGIIAALAGIISTGVPLVVSLVKAIKARKEAETAAEKEKANNDLLNVAQDLVATAEKAFASLDTVMKQQGASAGPMKKENVAAKLQAYALSKGYDYDAEYWSEKIDEIVAFTREVNAKKKTV